MKRIICYFLGHIYGFCRELNGGLPTGPSAGMYVDTLVVCRRCGNLKVERSRWD